jgi:hypothetical protein
VNIYSIRLKVHFISGYKGGGAKLCSSKLKSWLLEISSKMGTGSSCLKSWLLGRLKSGGSQFEATVGKKVCETSFHRKKSWAL